MRRTVITIEHDTSEGFFEALQKVAEQIPSWKLRCMQVDDIIEVESDRIGTTVQVNRNE